jgi:hypothetical protein
MPLLNLKGKCLAYAIKDEIREQDVCSILLPGIISGRGRFSGIQLQSLMVILYQSEALL